MSVLLDSYETLVTALDARPDDEQTLEYVKGKLVDEYKRKIDISSDGVGTQSVLRTEARERVDHRSQGTHHEVRDCFFCGRRGHVKRNCFAWKAKILRSREPEFKAQGQKC